jgi:alpha-L-fucosidase 2
LPQVKNKRCVNLTEIFAGLGEQAYSLYKNLLVTTASSNLFNLFEKREGGYLFQIDGNFGGGAALTEILLQSQNAKIELLPAIPANWADGCFKGLKARGGFGVGVRWADSALTGGQVRAVFDGPCRLRSTACINEVRCGNEAIRFERSENGVIEFAALAGKAYIFKV